uniref:hypothetical protein n=1 Tax=Segatella hominis TaxID=2518605 RepID=UPI0040256C89
RPQAHHAGRNRAGRSVLKKAEKVSLFKSPTDTTDLHRFILAINGRRIPQISKQKNLRNQRAFLSKDRTGQKSV